MQPVFSLQGRDHETPIFVERLIAGASWLSVMESLPMEENVDLLLTVSRTIAFAHERHRIIHGDLKPENVMLGEQNGRYNEVYIVDWGLAVSLDDPELAQKIPCGTIPYMAPESLATSGAWVSTATDVFMLGGILYRILTGKAPYEDAYYALGGIGSLTVVAEGDIVPVSTVNSKTGKENPPELIAIVERALQKDPQKRYAHVGMFADALERYRRRAGLSERLRKAEETFEGVNHP